MIKTVNFIISLLVFGLITILLLPAGTAQALSINPDYYYQQSCPVLSTKDARMYGPGSRGNFVTALQQFLSVEGNYTYGMGPMSWAEFTGNYGPVTTAAVADWQSDQGVVSSGSVYTTGYGLVGPQTRAAIAARCADKMAEINVPTMEYPSPYPGSIDATSRYENGTYTISGTLELLNGCYSAGLEGVTIQESYPEIVTVEFSAGQPIDDGIGCTQAIELFEFETTVDVSAKADIAFTVNGEPVDAELEREVGSTDPERPDWWNDDAQALYERMIHDQAMCGEINFAFDLAETDLMDVINAAVALSRAGIDFSLDRYASIAPNSLWINVIYTEDNFTNMMDLDISTSDFSFGECDEPHS